LSSYRKLI